MVNAEGRDFTVGALCIIEPQNVLHLFREESAQEEFSDVVQQPEGVGFGGGEAVRAFGQTLCRVGATHRALPQPVNVGGAFARAVLSRDGGAHALFAEPGARRLDVRRPCFNSGV